MNVLQEFAGCCIHWSLGITILIVVTASDYSGITSILALPITAFTVTISALCGASLQPSGLNYKKRKLCDTLDFFKIWVEILEILSATATCARVASATVDYISNGRLREWFLGLQSHSLGEPWPDLIGVSVVIVITGLFMLGLEKSPSFLVLLICAIITTFVFFMIVGGTHTVIPLKQWSEDIKSTSTQSILTAATLCSYGFVGTFPKLNNNDHRIFKIAIMVLVPLLLYSSTILVFTLMSHYKELSGTASPLLKVFELRDVDWARPVTAICIICISCLALTEILPTLYGLFVILASKEWQIFLTSLQYRSSLTGAPMLAIFASGSLAAILAFACPLAYLLKILSLSTLLKCTFRSLQVLFHLYKSETINESYLIQPSSTQYSKLKQSSKVQKGVESCSKSKYFGILPCLSKNAPSISGISTRGKSKKAGKSTRDDEYLLLNDYCDKSIDREINDDTTEESDVEKESVLSSDVEDSCSSTDIDTVVQEYKDKIQVATIDNFNEMRRPTFLTSIIATIFLFVIVISAICISQAVLWNIFHLLWPSTMVMSFSTLAVILLPKKTTTLQDNLLPKCLLPICATVSVQANVILASMIIDSVWPGFVFWFVAGALLFWRCDCCTCEGLFNTNQNKLNITENVAQCPPDKFVDTILISR